ncbi:amphi-Trp domain-containing protein [Thermodesulfobacterium sp. TA1]|uniref:amphi-Trp domain-containing protein n=1 Tax=Thermodesulfobacterium sp. TA1 TaxID=2234087 RepID=UPI00123275AC|nr:amphi-Trp domain-containing protein [Thermodesulfobacterium sp. TA1]QER42024.1 amphi-Trp domain-containing protein [Thermodesulfobacterium sp. TA1]
MKDKVEVKTIVSKTEAANLLKQIAEQIESTGQVKVGEVLVDLPEQFECEIEYKVKDDKKTFEIEFKWKA